MDVLTDFPERLQSGLRVELVGASGVPRPEVVASARRHGERLLVRFEGVENVQAAEALRGLDLCARPMPEHERPPGFVFHWEVEGCRAVGPSGEELGVVEDLVDVAGRPVLVVRTPLGSRDVPFTWPIVVSVDLARREIRLDPPDGLLNL